VPDSPRNLPLLVFQNVPVRGVFPPPCGKSSVEFVPGPPRNRPLHRRNPDQHQKKKPRQDQKSHARGTAQEPKPNRPSLQPPPKNLWLKLYEMKRREFERNRAFPPRKSSEGPKPAAFHPPEFDHRPGVGISESDGHLRTFHWYCAGLPEKHSEQKLDSLQNEPAGAASADARLQNLASKFGRNSHDLLCIPPRSVSPDAKDSIVRKYSGPVEESFSLSLKGFNSIIS